VNAAPTCLTGVRILVVDDHDDTRDLLEQVLSHAGAAVTTAASAREALERTEGVALIVTDYAMPGETGQWLLERVAQGPRPVPVIVVTGYAERYARQLAEAPFARVLTKPVDPWQLCEVVAAVLLGSASTPSHRPAPAAPLSPAELPAPRFGRVLVVEDEPPVAAMLEEVLIDLGYASRVVGTGAEALRVLADFRPDIVLLDLALPATPGDIVLAHLRQAAPRLPVIVVSGNTDHELARRTLALGAFDYIAKPFDLERLARALGAAGVNRS
jgi:two-component system, sensor histidine kinase and response regulator